LAWLAPSRGPSFGLISLSFSAGAQGVLLARKAVATMVPAAAKCMIDERNVNHPRSRD
jgi:hypothetical protein